MALAEDVDLAYVADNTSGFVGADLAQLCTEAAMLCLRGAVAGVDLEASALDYDALGDFKVKMAHFRTALGAVSPSTLRDTLVEVSKVGWDDVGGLSQVK